MLLETKYITPNSEHSIAEYGYWLTSIRRKGKNGMNALSAVFTVTKPTKKQIREMKRYVRSTL